MNKTLVLAFVIVMNLGVFAQSDWGLSTSVGVSKKLLPQLSLSLEEDFRLRSDFSEVDRFSTSLDLSYKPLQYLKVGGAYNLINFNHGKKGWEVRHRYYFYATGSYSIQRFNISLRERFQSTYRVGIDATAKRANPKLFLRSRLKLKYDVRSSGFEPYISAELYHPLNDPIENTMNKIRWEAGSSYKINKNHILELYYRYTNFIDDDDVNGANMLGFGYLFKF